MEQTVIGGCRNNWVSVSVGTCGGAHIRLIGSLSRNIGCSGKRFVCSHVISLPGICCAVPDIQSLAGACLAIADPIQNVRISIIGHEERCGATLDSGCITCAVRQQDTGFENGVVQCTPLLRRLN